MLKDPTYTPAVQFIAKLYTEGVPLKVFVTSDWHSAPAYVYLDMRGQTRKAPRNKKLWCRGQRIGLHEKNCKQYARLDAHGVKQALRWYKKMKGL